MGVESMRREHARDLVRLGVSEMKIKELKKSMEVQRENSDRRIKELENQLEDEQFNETKSLADEFSDAEDGPEKSCDLLRNALAVRQGHQPISSEPPHGMHARRPSLVYIQTRPRNLDESDAISQRRSCCFI